MCTSSIRRPALAAAAFLALLAAGCPGTTPDVTGMTLQDAQTVLAAAGFASGDIGHEFSNEVAVGLVVRQDPAAGSAAQQGAPVNLVLSRGPGATVPAVTGLTQAAAEAAITAASFALGAVDEVFNDSVPSGTVISQSPAAATVAAPGSGVDLVVSAGPPPVAVPDLRGMPVADAQAALLGAGFAVGAIVEEHSATVAAQAVIGQTPAPGQLAAPGSSVDLVVSSGPAPVYVPSVVGMTEAEARSAIVAAGLIIGVETHEAVAAFPAGRIAQQNPAPGTLVEPGASVDITVSLGSVPVQVPDLTGMTPSWAAATLAAAGLKLGAVGERFSRTAAPGTIIEQDPPASASVDYGSSVDAWTAIDLILIDDVYKLQSLGSSPDYPPDADYALANDIDASETAEWDEGRGFLPLCDPTHSRPPFSGSFDGRGFTIHGLAMNRTDTNNGALFGAVSNGVLKDVALTGVSIRCRGKAAGLAAILEGTIEGCFVDGSIAAHTSSGGIAAVGHGAVSDCRFTGVIKGRSAVGGIVGLIDETSGESIISNCIADVQLSCVAVGGGIAGYAIVTVSGCRSAGEITGRGALGGAVGVMYGEVLECSSSCRVIATEESAGGLVGRIGWGAVWDSFATGAVKADSGSGGLIGYAGEYASKAPGDVVTPQVQVSRCYATGAVMAANSYAGGLIGINAGSVQDSFAAGPVTGRIVAAGLVGGHIYLDVSRCYAIGRVSGSSHVHGLVGLLVEGTVADSFWNTETSGIADSPYVSGITTAQMVENSTFTAAGWDFADDDGDPADWAQVEGQTLPYLARLAGAPTHTLEVSADGGEPAVSEYPAWSLVQVTPPADEPEMLFAGWTGDGFDAYEPFALDPLYVLMHDDCELQATFLPETIEIGSINQLQQISYDRHYPSRWSYTVVNDINASETADWNDGVGFRPIGELFSFSGTLGGDGHEISGLVINRPDGDGCVGLFANLHAAATVYSLAVTGASITGGTEVGGVAGCNYGLIHDVSFDGAVAGGEGVGGIVGRNGGVIQNVHFTGTVDGSPDWGQAGGIAGQNNKSILNSIFLGALTGYYAGGIAGKNWGSIKGCTAGDNLTASYLAGGIAAYNSYTVEACRAHGNVVSGWAGGGIAGENGLSANVTKCASNASVWADTYAGGCVGRNSHDVTDSYATGAVHSEDYAGGLAGYTGNTSHVHRCYSTGPVSATLEGGAGGLVGYCTMPSVVAFSFWDTQTSGCTASQGGVGKTTAELMMRQTFTSASWNFTSVWGIDDGNSYPYLLWEVE